MWHYISGFSLENVNPVKGLVALTGFSTDHFNPGDVSLAPCEFSLENVNPVNVLVALTGFALEKLQSR